ncbi:TPA: hypothetical protein ACH3X2_14309 [Trebouxia sp. C0005]
MPASGQSVVESLQAIEARWVASMQPSSRGTARLGSEVSASLPAWMTPSQTPRVHWSDRQQQRQEQHQQQTQQQPAAQLPLEKAAANDTIDVLEACGSHAQQAQWQRTWELASASYLDRQHRVLWWRLLHTSLMCGAYRAYIGRATPAQATCPFSCCIGLSQPQTISHLFITCPVAATVTDWLCRLWQAMTGYLPVVSAASLLAADTPSEQLPSNELLQTWHRLRLAVLHSIWAASQIAQASRPTQAPDASEPVATLVSSPSSQQASFTSHHGHLARQLALKTIRAMIRNDWTKCNDDIRQISGVCSSWLRGKDPNMTLAAFQSLWCYNGVLASVTSPSGDVENRLELQLHLSATCPVLLC